ncbi:MAG: hypothetical protein WD876_03265, partial [Candidatus Pacearchaeota archaeon]
GMVKHNHLILSYNYLNDRKYLNISINNSNTCARMAEWLTRLTDTKCPWGVRVKFPLLVRMPFIQLNLYNKIK